MSSKWPYSADVKLPIPANFSFASPSDSDWRPDASGFWEERDLGLHAASGGVIGATILRPAPTRSSGEIHQAQNGDWSFLLVLGGAIRIEEGGGAQTGVLNRLDAVYIPPGARYGMTPLDGLRLLRFTAPGSVLRAADSAAPRGLGYFRDSPAAYTSDGPRAYISYRTFGVRELTQGRLNIQISRSRGKPMPEGGTGWHTHEMTEWFMVLSGAGRLIVKSGGDFLLRPGDAMTIGPDTPHNQLSADDDYAEFDVCIPADYATASAQEPRYPQVAFART